MFYEKVKDSIVLYLHKIKSEETKLKMNEMLALNSNTFLNNINLDNESLNSSKREAKIYIQSLGRNTFITVSLDNKLIYNKSLGKFKVFNSRLKKKDKRRMLYINMFLQSFNTHFFKVLTLKNRIESVSFHLNCLPRVVNTLLRDFSFKYYSRLYLARKAYKKYIRYKIRKYLRNKKLFVRLKIRKIYKKKLYLLDSIRRYKYNKFFSISSINYAGKISYNGCKKRKRKI
jgi:hypothetical protein